MLISATKHHILRATILVCSVALLSPIAAPASAEPQSKALSVPLFATGQSALSDPKAAGTEAATKAKAALGGQVAKLVVVFCGKCYSPELVDGIGSVFDKKLIYGGLVHSPITQAGNFADEGGEVQNGVAVLAIGGNCTVTVAANAVNHDSVVVDPSTDPAVARAIKNSATLQAHRACAIAIAAKLLAAYHAPAAGKLVVTFGTQHAGPNAAFAEGMIDVLGKNLKMVGGATGPIGSKQIVAGELVDSTSIAILITGDFTVATAASRDEPLKAAADDCKSLIPDGKTKPAVIFFFEDHLRRNALIKANTLNQETKVIADNSAGAVVFGMDDSGEIGQDTPTSPSTGSAMRTIAAAIIVPANP